VQNMDNETLGRLSGMGFRVPKESHQHDPAKVKAAKKPTGEWQDLWIKASGKNLEVRLNGEVVATSENLELTDGHIGLQAEGGVLEFERIEIKPL
jgi:hypothetical protein